MKKSKLLLVSWILGALYSVYLIYYFTNGVSGSDGMEQAGAAIASVIVMPHLVATALATIFTIFGWIQNKRGFTLVGAILYTVAIVLFPPYFMFVIIQMILSFIGYSKMPKTKEALVD